MTEPAKPAAKPASANGAKPATVASSNGAKPPAPAKPPAKPVEPPVPLIELRSDRRLAFALLLIGIGVGAAVVYLALTRLVIEDVDHA